MSLELISLMGFLGYLFIAVDILHAECSPLVLLFVGIAMFITYWLFFFSIFSPTYLNAITLIIVISGVPLSVLYWPQQKSEDNEQGGR